MSTLLKKLREEQKLSQGNVAKKLGVSRPTYSALEKGKRQLSLPEAERLAGMFGVSLDELAFGKRDAADVVLPKKRVEKKPTADMRISVPQKNIEKFKQVLIYVLEKTAGKPNIGMTALYKLLYFIDFDYYEKYDEQMMGLTYIKNHYGPTPREFVKVVEDMKKRGDLEEIKSPYFTYEQKKFLPHKPADLTALSGQEKEMIDSVLARYGDKSAAELTRLSHEDTPWVVAEEGENIEYEHVFYRTDAFSVREYDPL